MTRPPQAQPGSMTRRSAAAAEGTAGEFGTYDFGLSQEQESRAARLHAESTIADMLFWGPVGYRSITEGMEQDLEADWDTHPSPLKAMVRGQALPAVLAARGELPAYKECWDASGVTAGTRGIELSSMELALRLLARITTELDHLPWLLKALSAEDIRRAKRERKHAVFLNTQLATGPGPDLLEIIDAAHGLGLRMLQLTYNSLTAIGGGCLERSDAGVSNYGARVIARMNELGIIVDTSHCGRQTTLDACNLSQRPVVASHTSAQGVYSHARGKSDEELRAIANTEGVVGVVAVPFFLAPSGDVTIEAMLDHIDYIAGLIGWEHVALGTDWPMALPKSLLRKALGGFAAEGGFRDEHGIDPERNLLAFDDYRDYPNITRGLVKRGYSDQQVKGILGENFLHVFRTVCG